MLRRRTNQVTQAFTNRPKCTIGDENQCRLQHLRSPRRMACRSLFIVGFRKRRQRRLSRSAEHAERYARAAEELSRAGYAVYANDHRGHGRTARTPAELGLFAERDGWTKCIEDLCVLNRRIASEHPGLPIVLLGHSLGSFMTQYFISEHGETLAAAVLSGSNGKPPPIAAVGLLLARLERLRLGQRGHSPLMQRGTE